MPSALTTAYTFELWPIFTRVLIDGSVAGAAVLLDAFADALWLEDGLSKNTLASYRRDLAQFASFLKETPLDDAREEVAEEEEEPSDLDRPLEELVAVRGFFRFSLRFQSLVAHFPRFWGPVAWRPRTA